MSIVNLQIVQRSWGLFELAVRRPELVLDAPSQSGGEHVDLTELSYGSQFKYEEFLALPSRLHSLLVVLFLVIVAGAIKSFPPVGAVTVTLPTDTDMLQVRWIARRLMPQSGDGPTDEYVYSSLKRMMWSDCLSYRQLEVGALSITNVTTSLPDAHGRTTTVRTIFRGKGEPGYLLSSSKCSLCQFPYHGIYYVDRLFVHSHDRGMCLISRIRCGPSPSIRQARWCTHTHDCVW